MLQHFLVGERRCSKGIFLASPVMRPTSISDAFVKLLYGLLPSHELVFFGELLMLKALPLLKKPKDRWREVAIATQRLRR
jgi:S-adenosylmethionine uptake transporter